MLTELEAKLEAAMAATLARWFHIPVSRMEELVCSPSNPYLKGGNAIALLRRESPDNYQAFVQAVLPCLECQIHNYTFRNCNGPRVYREHLPTISPEEIPDGLHMNVGDEPVEVMEWDWSEGPWSKHLPSYMVRMEVTPIVIPEPPTEAAASEETPA